jgi:hypothetical protein
MGFKVSCFLFTNAKKLIKSQVHSGQLADNFAIAKLIQVSGRPGDVIRDHPRCELS